MVKSTGWNGELPSPASAAASISPTQPCADAPTSAATTKQPSAAYSTGRAPMRSTTKPATACPIPETTKNTVTSRPSAEYDRPNSPTSAGNSGGSSRWKKCEVPCATPTRPIVRASPRQGSGAGACGAASVDAVIWRC